MSAFCHNCGAQLGEQAKFCGACGEPVQPKNRSSNDQALSVRPAEILPPVDPRTEIGRPVRMHETFTSSTHHYQEFRDKTGGMDSFFQSFGSNVGGCFGQAVGCAVVLGLIIFGLAFLGAFN